MNLHLKMKQVLAAGPEYTDASVTDSAIYGGALDQQSII